MLLDDDTLGSIWGADTCGGGMSRMTNGDHELRGDRATGEKASRTDKTAGEGASRAETVNALCEDEGREIGEAADPRFVRTGFLRRPWKRMASP